MNVECRVCEIACGGIESAVEAVKVPLADSKFILADFQGPSVCWDESAFRGCERSYIEVGVLIEPVEVVAEALLELAVDCRVRERKCKNWH